MQISTLNVCEVVHSTQVHINMIDETTTSAFNIALQTDQMPQHIEQQPFVNLKVERESSIFGKLQVIFSLGIETA